MSCSQRHFVFTRVYFMRMRDCARSSRARSDVRESCCLGVRIRVVRVLRVQREAAAMSKLRSHLACLIDPATGTSRKRDVNKSLTPFIAR